MTSYFPTAAVTRELVRAMQRVGLCPRKAGGHAMDPDREPHPGPYNLAMMSRTDAQVHAMRSVVSVSCNAMEPVDVLPSGHAPGLADRLNGELPPDIRILSAVRCPAGLPARTDIVSRRYEMHVPLAALLPDPAAATARQWPAAIEALRTGTVETTESSFDPEDPAAESSAPLGSRVAYPASAMTGEERAALGRFREALAGFLGWNDWHNFTDKRSRSDGVRWRKHGRRELGDEWLRFPPSYYTGGPMPPPPAEDPDVPASGRGRRGRDRARRHTDLRERLKTKPKRLADPAPTRDAHGRLRNQHENWEDWPEEAWAGGMEGWSTDKGMRRCVTRCSADDPVVFVGGAGDAGAAAAEAAAAAGPGGPLEEPEGGWERARGRGYVGVPVRSLRLPDARDLSSLPSSASLPCVRVRVEGSSFVLHQIRSIVGLAVWAAAGGDAAAVGPADVRAFLDMPRAPAVPLAPASTLLLRDMELSPHTAAVMQAALPIHPWRGHDGPEPVIGPKPIAAHLGAIARGETAIPSSTAAPAASATPAASAALAAAVALLPPKLHLLPPSASTAEAAFFRRHLQPRIAEMANSLLLLGRFRALSDAMELRGRVVRRLAEACATDEASAAAARAVAAPAAEGDDGVWAMDAGRLLMPADDVTAWAAAASAADASVGSSELCSPRDGTADVLHDLFVRAGSQDSLPAAVPPRPDAAPAPAADAAGYRSAPGTRTRGLAAAAAASAGHPHPSGLPPLVPRERMTCDLEAALCLANAAPSLAAISNTLRVRLTFPGLCITASDQPAELARFRAAADGYGRASAPRQAELARRRWDDQVSAAVSLLGPEAVEECFAGRDTLLRPGPRHAPADDDAADAEAGDEGGEANTLPPPEGSVDLVVNPLAPSPDPMAVGARAEVGHAAARVLALPSPSGLPRPLPAGCSPDAAFAMLPRHLPVALRSRLGLRGTALQAVLRGCGLRVLSGAYPLLAPASSYVRLVEAEGPWRLVEEGVVAGLVHEASGVEGSGAAALRDSVAMLPDGDGPWSAASGEDEAWGEEDDGADRA